MATRLFDCQECGAFGKITLKNDELDKSSIVCCPVCGGDITEEEDYDDEEDQ